MQIVDNNRTDVVNKNIIRMQIFKSNMHILRTRLRKLQITTLHPHVPLMSTVRCSTFSWDLYAFRSEPMKPLPAPKKHCQTAKQ
jgi:hypothetical protein